MTRVAESPARRQVRVALRDLALNIKSLAVDEFDLQQLENLSINVDSMVLDQMSSEKPIYFAPYSDHSFPEPNDDDLHGSYNGVDDETDPAFSRPYDRAYVMDMHFDSYISYYNLKAKREGYRSPWVPKCIGDSAFGNIGLYRDEQPEFGCFSIAEPKDPVCPHVKAIIYNNMVATDSTILFGELMPILRIMLKQYWRAKYIHSMVSPVLVFSLMGLQARVIEAFFQGQELIIRPTKLYDFSHGNPSAFKTFTQWYMGRPIGDTTKAS
ncbi:hypothetical protein ASPTUDRAFT_124473 [Aspergillus tubingensis CBS 134.48]|uniref:Uncharacterized protein n=1 Tax=Aspergillus tubingensis (strain CBS 134.48) TaxID=767770 RepID=A0A1L9N1X7_ASPTC|nr:hypothetical protein ASPTUDRAFT_124473 [Aspergillus tubingensis CBS 134.48]